MLLYPWRKIPRYLLARRLGGFQSQSGCYGEEKNLLGLPEIESQFLGRLASNLSLYRLRYLGSYDKTYWPKFYP
jgi:hypothetical protein